MKLYTQLYNSPIYTEGFFNDVYIEEKSFKTEKARKYMSIGFEMYYFRAGEKIVLEEREITFYGISGDSITSNKLAIISILNDNYNAQVAAVPLEIEVPNPDYNLLVSEIPYTIQIPNPAYSPEIEGSQEFLTVVNPNYDALLDAIPYTVVVLNPDYDNQVASIPLRVSVPLLQYLQEHEGNLPEDYEVVDWGYPNFEDAFQYFNGGDRDSIDISITNPFAREWLRNTLVMKNEKIGIQFDFID